MKKIKITLRNKWRITTFVLALLLVVSVFTSGLGLQKYVKSLTAKRVANNSIDFINKNLLPQGTKASLISASAQGNGLYEVKFKILEREYDTFVSSDGKLLFPESIALTRPKAKSAESASDIPKKEKADTKIFVMAYCPYGNEAENAIKPVVDLFGSKANIELRYIVSKEGSKYNSLHGDQELNQDVREVCVQRYQKDKFWDFVLKMNEKSTSENSDKKWESVAKSLGINVAKIKDCQKNERVSILNSEIKTAEKYEATGSPTIVINDTTYSGDRTSNGYKEAICAGFQNQPQECKTKLSNEKKSTSEGGCK